MKRRWLIAALLLGLAQFGYGAWIPTKAWLSQILLDRAWQNTLDTQTPYKPWPWADTRPALELINTKHQQRFIVLENDSGQSLAFGPGLMVASSMPGFPGNTVISGHRDTHFSFLQHVQIGEVFEVKDRSGIAHSYQVIDQKVINSRNNRIWLNPEEDMLTLVTCYPFDTITAGGDLRYILTATRV